MVIKINSKPIKVTEENEEEQPKGWLYVVVSGIGYILCFVLLDYVCYTFLSIHPFPFLSWLGRWLS
jgi:hypothetical protein